MHAYVTGSIGATVKKNVDAPIPTVPVGPAVITAAGPTVSTVQVVFAGVGSGRMPALTARTSKVCGPCASPAYVTGLAVGQAVNAAPFSEHSYVTAGSGELNDTCAAVERTTRTGPT